MADVLRTYRLRDEVIISFSQFACHVVPDLYLSWQRLFGSMSQAEKERADSSWINHILEIPLGRESEVTSP
ncbi:hypothetical protein RRF57_012745 [Xylaria bambusicola]|uniref:Uncharacterized protein n=1 Tax=Xylaria bambusicola TaxID=326684 RepID=A0AAN7UX29_9PEZI